MKPQTLLLFVVTALASLHAQAQNALVLQTDFGLGDGAVSAMQGVAFGVDRQLPLFNLTHEIPPYDIWAAAYRLMQTAPYWPAGTVFVSVVDPGVGTDRKSVVLKTNSGHYFVSPDNGTLTLVAQQLGINSVREIDETTNRLPGSELSYTFHGRDVYAYTGARLAAGVISYEQVGPVLDSRVIEIDYQKPEATAGAVKGNIPILDVNYGNVWSNIDADKMQQAGFSIGDTLCVTITNAGKEFFNDKARYTNSFGDVAEGEALVYLNSLLNASVAINLGNFAEKYGVSSGAEWDIGMRECQ